MQVEGISAYTYTQPAQVKQNSGGDIPEVKIEVVNTSAQAIHKSEAGQPQIEGVQSEQDIINAIEKANKNIRIYDRRLEFSIHEATKQIMVKVIDTENDAVIREIPSEKILDMLANFWKIAGILVDEKI